MSMNVGDFRLDWLQGGVFRLDGGTMFGVVPKALWMRKYPVDEHNHIELTNSPILVRTPEGNVLIDTGLGNKLSDKQKKIFRVGPEWDLPGSLSSLGLGREDIDFVILTHYDFDHAGGVIMYAEDGQPELTFPKARHIVHKTEWDDVQSPDIRTVNTYLKENFSLLIDSDLLVLVEEDQKEVLPGVQVVHTGGHTRGHQVVWLDSGGETVLHMGDLLPTHVHHNPLWLMAYDNFPMDAIACKQRLHQQAQERNAWYAFYHDPFMEACRFGSRGEVLEKVEVADKV